jgi:malonyl CoA-acyl carrier protein transacylase/phosphopantetheinyl transferase/acyl carrier protein
LNVDEPNPALELEKTPFYLNTETRPWIHGAADTPRRAGVNSFGFGGINAHAILEEYTVAEHAAVHTQPLRFDTEVFILSGATRAELIDQVDQVLRFLRADSAVDLKDLAYTLNVPLGEGPFRLSVVAESLAGLQQKLERALERLVDPSCLKIKEVQGVYFFSEPLKPGARLAFLFPGEGSQYVNMLADLCIRFPEARRWFDLIDGVFADHSRGYVPSDFIFPRPTFSAGERAAAEERLWQMEGAFEAVLTASWALFTVLSRLEIRPDVLAGHSTGEYAAMHAAGMIDLPDEQRIARFATELNQFHYQHLAGGGEIPRATLLAVGADSGTVSALAAAGPRPLYVAMDNCPHQTVVVGTEDQTEQLVEELRRRGLLYERLPFDRPYHTPLFEPYAAGLKAFFSRWLVAAPRQPLYSCTTHSPFPKELGEIRQLAVRHWMAPVEFQKTVEAMYADGVRIFVEVGPRGNLTAFVEDILRGRPHLAVASDTMNRSSLTQLNHLLGLLAAHGVPMRLDYLYERRSPRKVALGGPDGMAEAETGGAKRGRPMKLEVGWIPLVLSEEMAIQLRTRISAAEPESRGMPSSPSAPKGEAIGAAPPAAAPSHPPAARPASADQLMSSYWRTMDQFLTTQEDVMQAFLGGGAAARGEPVASATRLLSAEPRRVAVAPPPAAATEVPQEPVSAAAASPDVKTEKTAATTVLSAKAISDLLLKIVGDRTGYPVEMIDLDLDLEADLGIDSIKRVEILGSFQQQTGLMQENDMEALAGRKTLRQVSEFLAARERAGTSQTPPPAEAPSPRPRATPPAGAFIGTVLSLVPGRQLVALREIRRDEDLYLRDHLGHSISVTDPSLTALAVMPITMSMEMMAEAASALVPDRRLVGMREVRAHRWLTVEGEKLTLKLVATAGPSEEGREVMVQIFEAEAIDSSPSATPIVEGTMVFGDTYPDPPVVGPFPLKGERPSKWVPGNLYEDVMFHGPAFRGVASMDRWGEDGAEATLQVLPSTGLFASSATPALVTDPILLDQPGQVVGFWIAEHLERAYVIFPFRLEALHLYGPSPAAPARLSCQARIALVGEQRMRSDLDVLTSDGRLLARFVGWWDQRFDVPRSFIHFLQAPRDVLLGEPWPMPVASLPVTGSYRAHRLSVDSFPKGFFTAHGGVWQRPLAHLVLSRRERELWHGLKTPEPRRLEWLLGRVVAKGALRLHLKERHGLDLSPADIEILPDAEGRPVPGGAWTRDVPQVPVLSVSHADGVAVAVVGEDDSAMGVGVDLEHARPMREGSEALTFSSAEQSLLASLGDGAQESWPLRLWCAKEAVAKALGLGLLGGPRALVVERLDSDSGNVQLRLSGEMALRLPAVDGRTLIAHTARERDLIVATSLYTRE